MVIKADMAGRSDIGMVRKNNEDSFYIDMEHGLMIVADGMGGHKAGEVASRIIVEALPAHLFSQIPEGNVDLADAKAALGDGIQVISGIIREKSERHPELLGMGSTIVTALLVDDQMIVAHSGDSRAYLYRSGRLECLTKDHNVAGIMYDAGMLNTEEKRNHPGRFALSQYSGMKKDVLPEMKVMQIHKGDRILLCSDGLTEMIPDAVISQAMSDASIKTVCTRLIELANTAGGRDNITVTIAEIKKRMDN